MKNENYKVLYVASAFNEESNLWTLYQRCLSAFEKVQNKIQTKKLSFQMLLIDNGSTDNTCKIIQEICKNDKRVFGVKNLKNYGSELSMSHGLDLAVKSSSDFIIMMCSDLQDPPELTTKMLLKLITNDDKYDSVFSYKKVSKGPIFMRYMRKLYYLILRFSDRDSKLISGFHGFACINLRSAESILWYLKNTNLNMRNSMTTAVENPFLIGFVQPERHSGKSSYRLIDYFKEAINAISVGKSLATRLSLRIGFFLFFISLVIAIFVLVNTMIYGGGYAGGIPTLTLLIVIGFATQVILLSMISRQLEFMSIKPDKLKRINSVEINPQSRKSG